MLALISSMKYGKILHPQRLEGYKNFRKKILEKLKMIDAWKKNKKVQTKTTDEK